jgi:uncharacterized protein YciI
MRNAEIPETNSDFCRLEILNFMRYILPFAFTFLVSIACYSQSASGKYFVFLNTNPDRAELPEAEVNEIQQQHMANMDSLAKERLLLAAGPFHGGGGLQILSASNIEEAKALVNSDPAVKAGRFNTEIFPLEMGVGGICPVQEPYEMVEYQFIRYVPVKKAIAEESTKKLEKYIKRHVNYLKSNFYRNGLIGNGDFGPGLGGFLLAFKNDDEDFENFLKYDPYVKSGLFTVDIRILWIAQGTFCERRKE